MKTKRQEQVQELIRRHLSIILQQEGSYIYGNEALVTLTKIHISPDLAQAQAYLSVYNTDNKQAILLEVTDNTYRIKHVLGNRLSRHLRRIPEIEFFLDDTLDEMHRLNTLFDQLHEDKQMGEEE